MQSELLNCPFCGSHDLVTEQLEGTIRYPAHRVRCDHCGASSRYSDRDDWWAAWNTRASDATIAALEASLRAAEEEKKALLSALEEWMFRYFWRVDGMPVEAARIHAQSRMKIAALAGAKPC